jgi:prepilin-type N-terminal cleavage/methylation domain-containing protein
MRRNAGFTLAEVLVALAVLGVVLSVGFDALRTSQLVSRSAQDTAIVTLLAQSKMEEFLSRPPMPGESAGIFPVPYDEFRWKAVTARVPDLAEVYKVVVEVSGKNQQQRLSSYLIEGKPMAAENKSEKKDESKGSQQKPK